MTYPNRTDRQDNWYQNADFKIRKQSKKSVFSLKRSEMGRLVGRVQKKYLSAA